MILQKVLATFYLIILVIPIFISLTPTFKILIHHIYITWRILKFLRWWYIRKFVNFTSKHKEHKEKLWNFLSILNYNFSIICFSETWLDETNNENSNYELPGYYSIHQIRNNRKGGGVSIYINKALNFKTKDDLSINCKDVESLCIKLLLENKRNTLINILYRPPNGQTESFEKILENAFSITKILK